MSVFGLDFGTLYSTVAITRNGGIDVVINEVSKRQTATYVSLTDQERCIGEVGLDRSVRNMANTIYSISHWIGMRNEDADLINENRFLFCNTTTDDGDRIKFSVNYMGEPIELYPEQVFAMFLQKMREYVNRECTVDPKFPANVRDCVITVPSFYSVEQRRLVYQACEIADINCMSLLNDSTASAIDYGIFRGTSLPEKEEDAQIVTIVDIGYGHTTVSTQKFWKGNMKVLGRICDKTISCREIDYALFEHFTKEIQVKYNINFHDNKRARLRVLQAVDKVKQMLSANMCAPLNIENLMDIDININSFTRDEYEKIIEPLVIRFKNLLTNAIANAGLDVTKIHAVEMIGGGCRIPIFKASTQEIFNRVPSFTLNASESVARGAAITAAVFSPKFQVREFVVNDTPLLPIVVGHENPNCDKPASVSFLPGVNDVLTLLGEKDHYPKVLDVTIKRSDSFKFHVFYDENAPNAKNICNNNFRIGEWIIGAPTIDNCDGVVKIRVRLLASGLIHVDNAFTHRLFEVTDVVEEAKDGKEAQVVKKQKKERVELSVNSVNILGHSFEVINQARKIEFEMLNSDIKILTTKHSKNTLESYILDNRSRVDKGGQLFEYITDNDRDSFLQMANNDENWLYQDGSNATFEEFELKLKNLKELCDPAHARYRLHDDAPFAIKQFTERVQAQIQTLMTKMNPKPSHITEDEIKAVVAKCEDAIEFGELSFTELNSLPKYQNSTFTVKQLDTKFVEVTHAVNVLLNKKPPKPVIEETNNLEQPMKNNASPTPTSPTETKKSPRNDKMPEMPLPPKEQGGEVKMDLD